MTDLISTDHPLDDEARRILVTLLDTLIPASDDGHMPGAGELDLLGWLAENEPGFIAVLPTVTAGFDVAFCDQSISERVAVVEAFRQTEHELFERLLFLVYACYYEDDRVLTGIGSAAGPPFPRGNTVEAGDLSLLDPVSALDKHYRPT